LGYGTVLEKELLERILFNTLECPESGFKEKGALSNND